MPRVRPESGRPSLKTARTVAWSVAGLGVLAAIWLAWRAEPALPTPTVETVARAPAVPAQSVPASRAGVDAPVPASAVAHLANDPRCVIKDTPPTTSADASADSNSPVPAPVVDPRAQASRARLLARLAGSADPYANAVALWLDVDVDSDENHLAERRRGLAAMAASSQDPGLYSLALRTCWRRLDHACQALSARRWSELDPDNAMPWMMMLDEAATRQDVSGVEEALFHVTHARRLAERPLAPLKPIVDAAGDDPESMVAARSLAIDAIGISAAQVAPIAYTACARATAADANLWQQCVAMVDVLEHRSDTLMARGAGARMDRRLTGNVEPGQRLSTQARALLALELAATSSCDDLRAKLAVMRRMAVEGEVAVARDLAR